MMSSIHHTLVSFSSIRIQSGFLFFRLCESCYSLKAHCHLSTTIKLLFCALTWYQTIHCVWCGNHTLLWKRRNSKPHTRQRERQKERESNKIEKMRNTISAHTRNNLLTKSETLYESIFIHRKRRINYTMFWPVNGMQQEQPKNPFSASKHRTTKCLLNALSLTRSTLSIYKRHCPMMLPTYLIYCTEHTPAQSHNIRAECIHFVRTVRNIVLCVCIFASVPIPLFFLTRY